MSVQMTLAKALFSDTICKASAGTFIILSASRWRHVMAIRKNDVCQWFKGLPKAAPAIDRHQAGAEKGEMRIAIKRKDIYEGNNCFLVCSDRILCDRFSVSGAGFIAV